MMMLLVDRQQQNRWNSCLFSNQPAVFPTTTTLKIQGWLWTKLLLGNPRKSRIMLENAGGGGGRQMGGRPFVLIFKHLLWVVMAMV